MGTALETSLVEWKHGAHETIINPELALETSLVEWKPPLQTDFFSGVHTLETSLVEWKPLSPGFRATPGGPLGNFLSGMETGIRLQGCHPHQGLGNFLSGMETQVPVVRDTDALRPWKLP